MRERTAFGVLGILGALALAAAVEPASAATGVTPQGPAQAPVVQPAFNPLIGHSPAGLPAKHDMGMSCSGMMF